MDLLFNGVGWTDVALALNCIAVGAGPYRFDAVILSLIGMPAP